MTERILIVDADDAQRDKLELGLAEAQYEAIGAASGEAALAWLETTSVDLVLCEFGVPGLDGLDLLPQIRQRSPGAAIFLMARAAPEVLAKEVKRRGAYDYIELPIAPDELEFKLHRAREREGLRRHNALLKRDALRVLGHRPIVAASPRMIEVLELMERAASFKAASLLIGERGTGKEVLARAIHAQSPRRSLPFVAADCATRDPVRLAGELFGHSQGALGGAERARAGLFIEGDGGTLYLDEVGELSETLQESLLRVIREEEVQPLGDAKLRKVDVRIIAATSRDLEADVRAGRFREDLFGRLCAMQLTIPSLRERREDIPLLVDHFIARSRDAVGRPRLRITDDALEQLAVYPWPGNVRELENVVQRAILLADSDRITLRQLPAEVVAARTGGSEVASKAFSLKQARRSAEAEMIERALSATGGNRTHAARLLGISHRALLYKIKDYRVRN